MKMIKYSLTKNLVWKLLSLFFAIILWLIAVGIENPLVTKSYSIPVEIKNISKLNKNNKVILNKDYITQNNINVKITGRRSDFMGISVSNVKAYIDIDIINFNNIGPGSDSIEMPIKAEINSMFSASNLDIATKPMSIKLNIDDLESKEIKIKTNKVADVSNSYISLDPIITPVTVKAMGAKSILDKIKSVEVDINLKGVKKDFVSNISPIVYDINNNDITNSIDLDVSLINVLVPINKCSKIPVLMPQVIGEVENGYKILSINYNPKYIDVMGKQEDIDAIGAIKLNDIDISGESCEKVISFRIKDLLKGTNLININKNQEDVTVSIDIGKENTKVLCIPIENFEIIGEKLNIEWPKYIEVTVKGRDIEINNIDELKIKGIINVEEISDANNYGEVKIDLPKGVELLKESLKIKFKRSNAEIESMEKEDKDNLQEYISE